MIDYELQKLFNDDSVNKKMYIKYPSGTITNTEFHEEEFTLTETLSTENELVFGSCEASSVSFTISNVFNGLDNAWLDIDVVLDHNEDKAFKIGKYKVYSNVPTADRVRREILAYDAMYDVINADVAEWYNTILPNADISVTLREFRSSFFDYFGIEQVDITLPNDDMVVKKTVQTDKLSGKDVVTAICEVNGCFGHINRDGKMDYVFLKERIDAIYPSDDLFPAEDLYPSGNNYETFNTGNYYGCQYEDYVVKKIDALEIREQENSLGISVGNGNNRYIINGNMLLLGKTEEELTVIAQKIFDVIKHIEYRPFEATMRANLCRELGDLVRFNTKYDIFYSYILERRVTGIQNLIDTMSANGEEYRTAQVNNLQSDVMQLRGKTNVLERNIDETRSEITKVETKANEYTDEKLKDYSTTTEMRSEISQSADAINLSVSEQIKDTKKYTDTSLEDYSTTTEMNGAISLSAQGITQEVSKTYTTKTATEELSETLSSRITQTADMIAIGIDANGNLVTDLTVDKNGMTFEGNYLVINTKNLQLDEYGANFSGDVEALSLSAKDVIKMYQKDDSIIGTGEEVDVMQFISKFVTPRYSQSILLIGGDGSYLIRFVSPTQFASHVNAQSTMNVTGLLTASGGVDGSVKCVDGVMRVPVGSTNTLTEQVNYLRAFTNSSGVTRIGFNGGYSGTTNKNLFVTVETSDERLKDDVADAEVNALSLINQIKHRQFTWKAQKSKQGIGYIAQELEKIDNRMVIPPESDDEYYQVNTFYMMGLVTKAIQELSAENKELKSEIDELKKSVSFLMEKLGGMENE